MAGWRRCAMQPNAKPANGSDKAPIDIAAADTEIMRLAGLPDLLYGRERKKAAEKLELPVAWLDKMVRAKKSEIIAQAAGDDATETAGQGRPIKLRDPEPWPHPVNSPLLKSRFGQPGSAV